MSDFKAKPQAENYRRIKCNRSIQGHGQNDKLRQAAFFNVHKPRGPFCRIQGVILLQDLVGPDVADYLGIKMKLGGSIEELDLRIRRFSRSRRMIKGILNSMPCIAQVVKQTKTLKTLIVK